MRPRHRAAEYFVPSLSGAAAALASMRPRHRAAEYGPDFRCCVARRAASMRPRHRAAEYDYIGSPVEDDQLLLQ